MKKLSKIMLSVAAAAVVTAAMAVTAMAADTITGTYDNETGVVTMEGVTGSGKSQTLLVLNNDAEDINSASIAYINQIDNSGTFSTFTLAAGLKPATASESVTYYIKIGGTNRTVQTGTLTIAGDAPATVTIVIGDATGEGEINMIDIARIGKYITDGNVSGKGTGNAGQVRTKPNGDTIAIGDATGEGEINMIDIARIGKYITDGNVSGKGTGNAGQEVEVIKEASDN